MYLIPIPAFEDNYIWLLHDDQQALVVDPGDDQPVRAVLQSQGLQLTSILVTHRHADHTAGVAALHQATGAQVYAPRRECATLPATLLSGGETIQAVGQSFLVLDIPGHTAGHIAFYTPAILQADLSTQPLLFCGDTLFSGGCGRLFDGTAQQLFASLNQLAELPDDTLVCCGHEYTLSNLRFAEQVEPDNLALQTYQNHCMGLRQENQPTLPTSIGHEKKINPFLRTHQPTVVRAAQNFDATVHDNATVFAALRQWKNEFQ